MQGGLRRLAGIVPALWQAGLVGLVMMTTARAADISMGDGGSIRLSEGERTFQLAGRAVMGAARNSSKRTSKDMIKPLCANAFLRRP